MIDQLGRVGEVADVAESTEVRLVGLDRARVAVGTEQDGEAGVAETEAEAAGAAEEVDRRRARRRSHPSPHLPRGRTGQAPTGAAAAADRRPR